MAKREISCSKEAEIATIQEQIKTTKDQIQEIKVKIDEIHDRLLGKDGLVSEHERFKGSLKVTQIMGALIAAVLTWAIAIWGILKR